MTSAELLYKQERPHQSIKWRGESHSSCREVGQQQHCPSNDAGQLRLSKVCDVSVPLMYCGKSTDPSPLGDRQNLRPRSQSVAPALVRSLESNSYWPGEGCREEREQDAQAPEPTSPPTHRPTQPQRTLSWGLGPLCVAAEDALGRGRRAA